MRVVDTLAANQMRQGSQEVRGSGGGLPAAPTAPLVEADTRSQLLKDFMAFRPPTFYGGTDVVVAENEMLLIEKYLHSIGCIDDHRVRLRTFLFRGDAERWWETARQRFCNREPTWVEFQQLFNDAYYPAWVKEQKVYEFIELVQYTMIVAQYETEFTALSRYTPKLVSTKAKKAAKFQRGLHMDIRHAFGGALSKDYATVVQGAYTIERDHNNWRVT